MLFVVHKTIVIKTGPSIKWVRGTFPNSVGSTVDSLLYYTKNNMWTNYFLLLCKLTTSPLLLCKPPHRPYNDELRRTSKNLSSFSTIVGRPFFCHATTLTNKNPSPSKNTTPLPLPDPTTIKKNPPSMKNRLFPRRWIILQWWRIWSIIW